MVFEEMTARSDSSRLPLLAFLVEMNEDFRNLVNEDFRNFVKENSKYVVVVYTSNRSFASAVTRPYSSLEELKIALDMRWPSCFLDKINSQPILEPCSKFIVSMNQIKGIPQEDLLECFNIKLERFNSNKLVLKKLLL